jgi:hypothetical protein
MSLMALDEIVLISELQSVMLAGLASDHDACARALALQPSNVDKTKLQDCTKPQPT